MKENLEETLNKVFQKTKESFGYVPLKSVSLSTEAPTAWINMQDFKVFVNPEFIAKLSQNMSEEEAIEGVLDHEFGHYLFHPYSLDRVIIETIAIKEKENGESIRQFYDDVNDNLRVLISKNDSHLPDVYRTLSPQSKVEKTLTVFYNYKLGKDFGQTQLDDECANAFESLKSIDFLGQKNGRIEFVKQNDKQNRRDLLKFHRIMNPLYEQDKQNGNTPQNPMGESPQIDDYSGKQIRKALKELIEKGQISNEDAKKFIKEHTKKFSEEKGDFPGGKYLDNPDSFADKFVYESLAGKYSITLKKTPLLAKEGVYPTRHEKFEVGDDLNSLDAFNSYGGKILPGLSNKWVKENLKYHGQKEATPNLMILLDDSGSMPNPSEEISNAVLGSFAVANEYLKNGAKISVGRFSDRTTIQDFTNDKYKVLDELLRFKSGGDTQVDLKEVEKVSKGIYDLVLITDGHIGNRDRVLEYMNSYAQKGARSYVIEIGNQGETYFDKKVKIIPISSEEDIGKIILDDIHKGRK
ncbi:MAG: hypothetical protein PHU51_02205 [Candidatus Nanoarchaeia archaeon]|nr:hypothetical protein [Candidatus Nanoarchaeia archaeon]